MPDIAELGLRVEDGQVLSATSTLEKFSAAAKKSETSATGFTDGSTRLSKEMATAHAQALRMNATLETHAATGYKAKTATNELTTATTKLTSATSGLSTALTTMAAAFGLYQFSSWAKGTLDLAARYETLGVAMTVVGRNAGYNGQQMRQFETDLRRTGISMIESRNNLARMAAAQLDLAKAQDMGRVAQDAAVIAGINSSEAFERLIQGIVSGQPRILHTMGIFADFGGEEKKWADAHGQTMETMSQADKVMVRFDATLGQATKRAGAYEAALQTAGKQMQSSVRYLEDMRVKVGEAFLPTYTKIVFQYADALKYLGEHASAAAGAMAGLGTAFGLVGASVGVASMVALFTAIGASAAVIVPVSAAIVALAAAAGLYTYNAASAAAATYKWKLAIENSGAGAMAAQMKEVNGEIQKIVEQMARQGFQTQSQRDRLQELADLYKVLTNAQAAQMLAAKAKRDAELAATKTLLQDATEELQKAKDQYAFYVSHRDLMREIVTWQDKLNEAKEQQKRIDLQLLGIAQGMKPTVGGFTPFPTTLGNGAGGTLIGLGSAPKGSGLLANDPTPTPAQQARYAAWLKETVSMEQRAAEDKAAIYGNFLRGMQESFARTFENIFTKGIKSFDDLFRSFGDLVKQAASQLAASGLMNFLTGNYAKGAAGGGGILGGVQGIMDKIPGVAVVGTYLAGIASSIMATAKQNAAAQRAFEDANVKWQASFESLVASFTETGFDQQRAALAQQFQSLADAAVAAAADAIKNSPATWNLRAGRDRDKAPNIGALGSLTDLDAYISQLRALIGTEKNRAQGTAIVKLIAQLEDLNVAYKKQAEALAEVLAAQEASYLEDLKVRALRAVGMDNEAEALALWNQQVREFADAVKAGFSMEFLQELSRTQELERNTLAAAQAAETAAEAQRVLAEMQERAAASATAAAERLAATQERAAAFAITLADATESLGVRMLRATGNFAEADRKAFELQQKQELRNAQREIYSLQKDLQAIPAMMFGNSWNYTDYWGGPYGPAAQAANAQKAAINKMIADQYAYIAELQKVQAAEATAFGQSASMPGATAAVAGTAGSFNTIVSRATATQADRLVDEATTSRVLLQTFLPFLPHLKTIAERLGGSALDTLLGGASQGSLSLSGTATVS